MSRVYDALQQCTPASAEPGTHSARRVPGGSFLGGVERVWDPLQATKLVPDPLRLQALPALQKPGTFLTEQFRYLSARLHQIREGRQLKTVVVTSSVAEEGKSFISINLAIALSRGGRNKVLLLEADLRRPTQCKNLGFGELVGLGDWCGAAAPSSASSLYQLSGAGCWLLPAGTSTDQPLETVTSRRFSDLLNELSSVFDWIVADSAPMLPMADAGIVSQLCDGTLLVVRRNTTPKSGLLQALGRIAPGKFLGAVLNDFERVNHYGYERYYGSPAAITAQNAGPSK